MALQTNLTTLKKPSTSIEIVEQWLDEHPEKRAEALTGIVQYRGHFGNQDLESARRNRQRQAINQRRINEELVRIAKLEKRK